MEKMSNIIDYVRRMKDVPFEIAPLNEIDSLIFSQLAYLDYSLLPTKESYSFLEIYNSNLVPLLVKRTWNAENNSLLFSEISTSTRFRSIKVHEVINLISESEETQFSAVTFELSNNHYFLSFRGTTSTFVGWKEDLNMSYLTIIPSQKSAADYLERIHDKFGGKYYLGGHSKGGTLAVFAAVFTKREINENIIKVFNHDGPGIHSSLRSSDQFRKTRNRIQKIVPEASVVGIMLEEERDVSIIKSSAWSILQHDPYTWLINEDKFLRTPSTTRFSNYTQRTISSWVSAIDEETKRNSLASLYEITKSMETTYLADAVEQWPKNIKILITGVKYADKGIRKDWGIVTKTLIEVSMKEGTQSIKRIHG